MLRDYFNFRSSHRRCSIKKGVLRNFTKFTGKRMHQIVGLQLIKKETLAQVFSCEFYEISKNTFFTEHLWTTVSVPWETNLPSYPRRPFNLSSCFKQTLQNKPQGKLFCNSTIFCLMRMTF